MKINSRFAQIVIVGLFAVSACTVNVNQPANVADKSNVGANQATASPPIAAASPQIDKARWSAVVCSSQSKTVTMAAGAGESDSRNFATWTEGSTQRVFDFPARLQNLSAVYFEASGSDGNTVELCVTFDGFQKKRVSFDEDRESHIINSSDDDDDCRCTE